MSILTGRSTTFTWSGDIGGRCYDNNLGSNIVPFDIHLATAECSCNAGGCSISVVGEITVTNEEAGETPPPNHRWIGRKVTVTTPDGSDVGFAYEAYQLKFGTDIYDQNIDGSYSISVDVEEVVDIWEPTALLDPPGDTHVRQWWRARVGGSITVSCSAGGASATRTMDIDEDNTYEVSLPWSGTGECFASWDTGDFSLEANFNLASLGVVSYSRTFEAATATVSSGITGHCVSPNDTSPKSASPTATLYPDRSYSLVGTTLFEAGNFGNSIDYSVDRYAGAGIGSVVSGSPSFTDSYTQHRYSATCNLSGHAQDTVSANDWTNLKVRIRAAWLTGNNQDTNSYRCMQRGRYYDACTLGQEPEITIDACDSLEPVGGWGGTWEAISNATVTLSGVVKAVIAGGEGSVKRTFSPNRGGMGGYRYFGVKVVSSGGNDPYSVTIGSKVWTKDRYGTALKSKALSTDEPYFIDLCVPNNATADTDAMDSRWPTPTPNGDPAGTGCFWGIQHPLEFTLGDLTEDKTYYFHEVRLQRLAQNVVSFGAPLGEWITESDSSGRRQFLKGQGDYKQNIEETDATLSGGSVSKFTIDEFIDQIGEIDTDLGVRNPGWACVLNPTIDVADSEDIDPGYLNKNRPASWLWGAGALYARPISDPPATSSSWINGYNLTIHDPPEANLSVRAQILYDEIDWQPICGDLWGHNPDATRYEVTGALVCAAAARLNGVSWGLCVDQDNNLATSVHVTLTDLTMGGICGLATVASNGGYLSGTSGGPGTHSIKTEVEGGAYVTRTFYSRKKHRICLRAQPSTEESDITYDVSLAMRHAIGYIVDDTIRLKFGTLVNAQAFDTEVDTGITGSNPCVRYNRYRQSQVLLISYIPGLPGTGVSVSIAETSDEGGSISVAYSYTPASPPKHQTLYISAQGTLHLFWVNEDNALKGLVLDSFYNVLVPEFTVVGSGVDDDSIACHDCITAGGVWNLVLMYRGDGTLQVLVASNSPTLFA